MKIVNKSGIPDIIHSYLSLDSYDYEAKGKSYSATELLKSVQEIILTRKHFNDIEVDSADRIWSLFGSAVHSVLENGKLSEYQEKRYFTEIGDNKVSGKIDMIKDKVLYDFKCTSVWTLIYNSREEEWRKQLSIYRWLFWRNEKTIELDETAYIIAILRDWSEKDKAKYETKGSSNYPKAPIVQIPIKLLDYKDTFELISNKLIEIERAEIRKELPPCTKEERWWNEKKGIANKCSRYCSVVKFCEQYQKEKANEY